MCNGLLHVIFCGRNYMRNILCHMVFFREAKLIKNKGQGTRNKNQGMSARYLCPEPRALLLDYCCSTTAASFARVTTFGAVAFANSLFSSRCLAMNMRRFVLL